MDDNTETVELNAELKIVGIFTDFSQVKIEVHGTDAAEKILGDLTDHSGDEFLTEYHDYPDRVINGEQIPNWAPAQVSNPNNVSKQNVDYIETISLSSSEQNLEDGPEEILGDCLEQIVVAGSEHCSDQILGDCPTQILEDCSDQTLSDCTDQVLQDCPDQILQNFKDQVLQDCPDQVLQDCPKQIFTENYIQNIVANHTAHEDGRNSPDYMGAEIKEEIDHFEGTDFTDFDEGPPESYHNDLPPEDIYHFRNKIILGTKPCLNNSDLSLEHQIKTEIEENVFKNNIDNENLDAFVLLKDWGPHLEKSSSFCKKCGILFATPNILDSHNMTTHSFLVAVSKNVAIKSTSKPTVARKSTSVLAIKNKGNIARKSTGNGNNIMISKFCNHCNVVFPDHTALIKHLYELLPLKQFSCNICEAVFNTQSDLIEHNTIHLKKEKPKIKKEKVDIKKTELKNKLLYEEDLKKKKPSSPKVVVGLIPMSVLFQCTKCKLHFLSCLAALLHALKCTSGATRRKPTACTICKRKLRSSDMDSHRKQHEICSKFQVYKITKNLFERTLCRCPKCGVHFNDYTIKKHLKSCGKLPTANCRKCNILLPKSKIESHLNIHIKQNLKPKDFIIVQHCIYNRSQKLKLEATTSPTKKIKMEIPTNKIKKEKIANINLNKFSGRVKPLSNPPLLIKEEKDGNRKKLVDKFVYEKGNKSHTSIFFCSHCKLCAVRKWRAERHLKKKCLIMVENRKKVCTHCGLLFHKFTFSRHMKLHKMRKFTIHDMRFYQMGTSKPVVPAMPPYPQCENCKITFFCNNILNKHICGEDYESCNVCGEKFHKSAFNAHMEFHKYIEKKQTKPNSEKIMPELIKKYKSLNMMWNIVYSCKKCDIVTDLYDKAVEHSQSHLHHETSTKNIKCYICNLKFDETCWSKHSDLHSRMNINSKDFKILVYDPKKLLTEEWFELFERLPEEQIRQITDKSLYSYERGTKMKLLKDGRSEFTVYCCSDCKVCCRSNEIDKHIKSSCKTPENFCKICNIPFCDVQALRTHEMLHSKGVSKDEIRIVNFKKMKHERKKSKKSAPTYVIHKCKNCTSCMRGKYTKHRCPPKHRIDKCKKCNLSFTVNALTRHKADHTNLPDFNIKNIKVTHFDLLNKRKLNEDEDYEPVKKIKTSPKTVKQAKISKRKADTLISVKASKVPKYDKSTKVETKTSKVFKCNCGLHFTSLKTIEKHVQTCSRNSYISKENCSKCGLLFPTDVLVSHLCKHHSKNTKIVIEPYQKNKPETNFDSVESTSECQIETRKKIGSNQRENTKSVTPTKNCKVKLYKCSECNIYFMIQNTCYKHVYKAHQPIDPRHYIECKLCGLQFTIKALSQHISKHHQKEFSLDTVLVEEYHPPLGKGPPKIDIYVAAEKVQSLQVSSSIEDRVSNS